MPFDWQAFLDARGIDYETAGPRTTRNNISIPCPFCGGDANGHTTTLTMGINLLGKGWHCWRRKEHSGINPIRLVMALIGCNYEQAATITGQQRIIPENFASKVTELLSPSVAPEPAERLALPVEFKAFHDLPSARPFVRYLEGRGFTRRQIMECFTQDYDIRYCLHGAWRYRVMFPVVFEHRLVNWVGRTIGDAELRYKALSVDHEKAAFNGTLPASAPITNYLLWYDDLLRAQAHTIVLCEGPFDALKVRILGWMLGVEATCFFTADISIAQLELLHELLPRFRRRLLLLDQGTLPTAIGMQQMLAGLDVDVKMLPKGIKDPALLTDLKFLLA